MHCGLALAGQLDALFKHSITGALCLVDWKRTKTIEFHNPFRTLKPPLESLSQSNGNLYSLQLNTYAHILESEYAYNVASMFLAQVHPTLSVPRLIEVQRLHEHMEALIVDQIEQGCAVSAAIPGENVPFELPSGFL